MALPLFEIGADRDFGVFGFRHCNDLVWNPISLTKNRERLHNGDVFTKFITQLLNLAEVKVLCRTSIYL